ncbi:hypothetical protein HA466_0006580 [Hirschfeldia incana]|nr:hypothetical protein HA466_0006580 [Hirschfeldia incana]
MDAHHTHTNPSTPGYFSRRAPSLNDRNFSERAFTVGIGVPVGTGWNRWNMFFLEYSLHVLLVLSFFYQEMRDANGQWELKKIQSTSAETLLVTANVRSFVMLLHFPYDLKGFCLLTSVILLLSKAVKVFTEELFTANPDILEGVEDVIQLSYLN